MTMTFRTTPPPFTTDFRIVLEPLTRTEGLAMLYSDKLEVFRLELIFPFGILHAPDIETGQFFPLLITLGTAGKTAAEITEGFERLGGFLDISTGLHRTTVTLHGLSRYFQACLPLLSELIFHPVFPEAEIEIQRTQALQTHQVDRLKPTFVANRAFKEVIYGPNSLAGQTPDAESIGQLNRATLQKFHAETFGSSPFDLYLCGHFSEADVAALHRHLGPYRGKGPLASAPFPAPKPARDVRVEMDDSIQSSLVIGRRLFNRAHPDFFPFLVTNTVFGGYFGSRLMKNIREEKGLTYGISSSLTSNGPDGVFSIRAELNKEKLQEALEAIDAEKETLRTIPVEEHELTTVKNYIKGNILSGTNTIFDIMDKHKAIFYESLPPDFYENMSMNIDRVTPEKIMAMTDAWFRDFSTVIAG